MLYTFLILVLVAVVVALLVGSEFGLAVLVIGALLMLIAGARSRGGPVE